MKLLRELWGDLLTFVGWLSIAAVAGTVIGTFVFFVKTVAGLAPDP